MRVAVLGARGKLGREVCRAVSSAPDLELVAEIGRGDALDLIAAYRVDVAVDFTEPAAVARNVSFDHGICAVIGTTGLEDSLVEDVARRLARAPASAF